MKSLALICLLGLTLSSPALRSDLQLNTDQVLQIIQGFFQGIGTDLKISQVQTCLTDINSSISDFDQGVADLKKLSFSGIKNGLSLVASGLKEVPVAISTCKAAGEDVINTIEAGIQSFTSPWSLIFHVGIQILLNGRQIYTQISAAVSDWESSNYEGFGDNVGKAMFLVFDTAEEEANLEAPDFTGIIQLIGGYLEGIGSDLPANDIKSCVSNADTMGEDLKTAMTDFSQKSFDGIENGLYQIGSALKILPVAITDCTTAYSQTVTDIKDMCSAFTGPWSLVYHVGKALILNGAEIFDDISNAEGSWKAQQWFTCGYDLGQAMFKVITGAQSNSDLDFELTATLDVVEGLLEGISMDLGIEEVAACIQNTQNILQEIETSVKDFELKSFKGVYDGLKMLSQALRAIPGDINTCKSGFESVTSKLEKALETFSNPFSLVWVVGKTLVLDGKTIYQEFQTANADWKNKDYIGYGFNVGEALFKFMKNIQQLR